MDLVRRGEVPSVHNKKDQVVQYEGRNGSGKKHGGIWLSQTGGMHAVLEFPFQELRWSFKDCVMNLYCHDDELCVVAHFSNDSMHDHLL